MQERTETGRTPPMTRRVADWAAGLDAAAVPDEVLQHTSRLVLDAVATGIFGTTTPWAQIVRDQVLADGGAAEAAVWGSGIRVPATQAPLANGTFIHSFEFDDLHAAAVIHGTAQVVPAALAVAEQRAHGRAGAHVGREPLMMPSGEELLVACVAGLEVGARIGLATGAEQLAQGFHPSPNTGLFSAAVTAGLLSGLDAERLMHAMGIAGSSGGFLMAAQYGAMVKRMHPGRAAQAGVLAAQLAARGFTGIANVIEEPYGGFARAYTGVDSDLLSGLDQELGERWETLRFSAKAYPCCGSNHTSVDAYRGILDTTPDLVADDIERIEVHCSTRTAHHVGWPYEPDSVTTAQMNLPYTLAVFATDRQLFVEQFAQDRIADPKVVDLASRVHIHPDPGIDSQGRDARHLVRLTVITKDGRHLQGKVKHARGSAHRPLTVEETTQKYRRLAGVVLAPSDVSDLESSVLDLASATHSTTPVARLLQILGQPSPSDPYTMPGNGDVDVASPTGRHTHNNAIPSRKES